MSLNNSNKKPKEYNWANLPDDIKKQLNFIKNHNNKNTSNSINWIDSKYNYNKIIPNKIPHQINNENRSSSTSNLFHKNKDKKKLVFFPINLKVPLLNNRNKNFGNKNEKSPIDLIKVSKNNNNGNFNNTIIKLNNKKNKENNNINYIFNTYNLSSKNANPKNLIKKKTIENNNNGLSNSMILINNNKVSSLNSNSNIIACDTNINNISNDKNIRFENAKKEKERLNALFNEKIKDSQKINDRINELEKKNTILVQKIDKIKKENDNLSSTLDKIIKLIKLLKNNGFDVGDIMNNLSYYDDEFSNLEEKKDVEGKSISSIKDYSFKIGDEINESNYGEDSVTNEPLKCHENFKQSKIVVRESSIPKLNIKKIVNIKRNQIKQHEEFSFKNNKKIMSHSVGE